MAHCRPSIRGQVRELFPSVRLILPFFVGERYSSSLQVCFQLWNLPVFKIFFLFRQTSHNFPYICCIFKASFPALASHSCERAHSSQGHRGIRISSIVEKFYRCGDKFAKKFLHPPHRDQARGSACGMQGQQHRGVSVQHRLYQHLLPSQPCAY